MLIAIKKEVMLTRETSLQEPIRGLFIGAWLFLRQKNILLYNIISARICIPIVLLRYATSTSTIIILYILQCKTDVHVRQVILYRKKDPNIGLNTFYGVARLGTIRRPQKNTIAVICTSYLNDL